MSTSFEPVLTTMGEWNGHRFRGLKKGGERFLHFGLRVALHELIGQRERRRSVGDDGDLEVADLVAIKPRRLLASRRRCGESR
jgi:hypothetical protein